MNKIKLVIVVLCACLLTVGIASAQPPQQMRPEAAPVVGYSPNFADPQPITGEPLGATLAPDANRLIRWQGWLDVDAFATSVLNQIQMKLGKKIEEGGIELGEFKMDEGPIGIAIKEAASCDPTFQISPELKEGNGVSFTGDVKLYVWTYRHNFADTGLHQLYISVKGKMPIGRVLCEGKVEQPYDDLQGPEYEFSANKKVPVIGWCDKIVDIEIWRVATVCVNARGKIVAFGNEAKDDNKIIDEVTKISDLKRAPSLEGNEHYNPKDATGAAFVEPLDRVVRINENDVQVRTGSVQMEGRVRTINPYTYRAPQK